jgi:pyruvate,water dikinase
VPDIVWFKDVAKGDVALVGGKGANLGELTSRDIPVPPGFIVTAEAYSGFLKESGIESSLLKTLATADDETGATSAAAAEARALISEVPMPDSMRAAILGAYRELGAGLVAVRSSATAEDLAEASFAGQQSTYLNVQAEEAVLRAVQDCWASLFEDRAVVYRRQTGFDHSTVKIAVVVQSMVQSDRSGVMFTVNPVTGDSDGMIIEAIMGLGEAAVSGLVTPDMYILDKASLQIQQKEIAQQDQQLVRSEAPGGGDDPNAWVAIPPATGREQKLGDEQIKALAELGIRIEQHYGRPQDIEWALFGDQFFILQARPVTGI